MSDWTCSSTVNSSTDGVSIGIFWSSSATVSDGVSGSASGSGSTSLECTIEASPAERKASAISFINAFDISSSSAGIGLSRSLARLLWYKHSCFLVKKNQWIHLLLVLGWSMAGTPLKILGLSGSIGRQSKNGMLVDLALNKAGRVGSRNSFLGFAEETIAPGR